MERGSRRLLNDLSAFGRLYDARAAASERLRREIGEAMMHRLLADGGRAARAPGARRRRIA